MVTSPRRRPGGILTRCLSHLIWLLSMRRSSGSTPRPSRMTELFTLSLRESTDSLRRKSILAACICDLVLPGLVTIGEGTEHRLTGKSRASPSSSAPSSQRQVGAEPATLRTLHRFACQSAVPFVPHSWTRPRDTWTPPLWEGSLDHFWPEEGISPVFRLRTMVWDLEVLILLKLAIDIIYFKCIYSFFVFVKTVLSNVIIS